MVAGRGVGDDGPLGLERSCTHSALKVAGPANDVNCIGLKYVLLTYFGRSGGCFGHGNPLSVLFQVALGYPGEIQDKPSGRWLYWALAMIPFLFVVAQLAVGGPHLDVIEG